MGNRETIDMIKASVPDKTWKTITSRDGYVAQDHTGQWFWFEKEPIKSDKIKSWSPSQGQCIYLCNGKPPELWDHTLLYIQGNDHD